MVLDKNLEGSIFTNCYFEGLGSMFASLFTLYFYKSFRMQYMLQFALTITIVSYGAIIALEQDWINPSFMGLFFNYSVPDGIKQNLK